MQFGKLYLIPTVLYEDAIETIPPYILDAVKDCSVFFVEQEKVIAINTMIAMKMFTR